MPKGMSSKKVNFVNEEPRFATKKTTLSVLFSIDMGYVNVSIREKNANVPLVHKLLRN